VTKPGELRSLASEQVQPAKHDSVGTCLVDGVDVEGLAGVERRVTDVLHGALPQVVHGHGVQPVEHDRSTSHLQPYNKNK
jgi:hypothetical protein